MVLYIGAGMTVRATFGKIAEDALNKGKTNPIYKEMMYVCRKMQSGMMETEAYEMLGKRTDVQEYIKMGTLLGQNIKNGNYDKFNVVTQNGTQVSKGGSMTLAIPD